MSLCAVSFDRVRIVRRRRPVISNLSFDFRGGVLGVMWPNGAGKSSLFSALCGERRLTSSGTIAVHDAPLNKPNGKSIGRARIGFQPQIPVLVPDFTVSENIDYAGWLKGVTSSLRRARRERDLGLTNLGEPAHVKAKRLSGRERKRAAIAAAVVHRPPLVVLDEPTAALDPEEHGRLLEVVNRLADDCDVVFSTHDPQDVAASCTEVLTLDKGVSRYFGSVGVVTREHSISVADAYREVLKLGTIMRDGS